MYMLMIMYWLLSNKAKICLEMICQVTDLKWLYLVVGHLISITVKAIAI